MALYNDQGLMEAERLQSLIQRFQGRPEIVGALQRQLDGVLGRPQAYDSEPERYAADQGMYDVPNGYQQRTGSADKWAALSPAMQQRMIKMSGAENLPDYQAWLAAQQQQKEYIPPASGWQPVGYDNSQQIKEAGNDVADFDATINSLKMSTEEDKPTANNTRNTRRYSDENAKLSPLTTGSNTGLAALTTIPKATGNETAYDEDLNREREIYYTSGGRPVATPRAFANWMFNSKIGNGPIISQATQDRLNAPTQRTEIDDLLNIVNAPAIGRGAYERKAQAAARLRELGYNI